MLLLMFRGNSNAYQAENLGDVPLKGDYRWLVQLLLRRDGKVKR